MDEISTITQSVLNCLDVLKRNRSCSTSRDINIKSNVTNAVTGILLWPPLALSTHKKTLSIGLGSLGCLLCSLTFDALRQPAVEQLLVKHYLARKKTFDCNRIEKTALDLSAQNCYFAPLDTPHYCCLAYHDIAINSVITSLVTTIAWLGRTSNS